MGVLKMLDEVSIAQAFETLAKNQVWKALSDEADINSAFNYMDKEKLYVAPVLDTATGNYEHILSIAELVQYTVIESPPQEWKPENIKRLSHTIKDVIASKPENFFNLPVVAPGEPLSKLATVFAQGHHKVRITKSISEHGFLVSQHDLITLIGENPELVPASLKEQKLSDLGFASKTLTSYPMTENTTALQVVKGLVEHDITAVPLIDPVSGAVVGNFSLSDLKGMCDVMLEELNSSIADFLKDEESRGIMARPLIVHKDANLDEAITLLALSGCHRIWVVDDAKKPVGLVSLTDVYASVASVFIKDVGTLKVISETSIATAFQYISTHQKFKAVSDQADINSAFEFMDHEKLFVCPVLDTSTGNYEHILSIAELVAYTVIHSPPESWKPENIERLKHKIKDVINSKPENFFNLPVVDPDESLAKLAAIFAQGYHKVRVTKSISEHGFLISQHDFIVLIGENPNLIPASLREEKLSELGFTGKSLITFPLVEQTTALDVVKGLVDNDMTAVPLVDPDSGAVLANFSLSDLKGMCDVMLEELNTPVAAFLKDEEARGIMARPLVVDKDSKLDEAITVLALSGCHRVWVVDETKKPVGLVSLTDIYASFASL